MKTSWVWTIEIWSEELVDGHQAVPYQPGALLFLGGGGGGINCLVVFPTHFNPNNFLLILLQIYFTPIQVYPRLKSPFNLIG